MAYATGPERRARMILSPKVAWKGKEPQRLPSGKPVKKSTNSPFGGMNMRSAQIHRLPDQRSRSEIKRSTGGYEGHKWSERDKPSTKPETYHALKMHRALASVSYQRRGVIKEKIADIDNFYMFDLLPIIKESVATQALIGIEEITPTPIQRIAIPAILGQKMGGRTQSYGSKKDEMESYLIAAETGSGKTLAYLLPVLDALKRAEAIDVEIEARYQAEAEERRRNDPYYVDPPPLNNAPHATTGRPRAIILLPTSELVSQVATVAKSLSHSIKFRASGISSSQSARVIRNRIFSPQGIDLLISTPSLLTSIAESDPNILSRVSHIVVDEADSLLDRSFAPITTVIIDKAASSLKQLILCSATIPRSLDTYLRTRFPEMQRLVTPNLHAIPRRVQLGVVDVEKTPYSGNKLLACADTIWSIGKAAKEHTDSPDGVTAVDPTNPKRLLVFVNEREKTQEVAEYLQSKGIDALALSRDTPEQRQSELLSMFTSATPKSTTQDAAIVSDPALASPSANFVTAIRATDPTPPRRVLPNTKVLVTTDLGSRGIDTLAVRHVILFDVPHSTIDFIHRLGRTGRMGRRGRGIVLVGKGDRRDVVREVREGMFRGQALI